VARQSSRNPPLDPSNGAAEGRLSLVPDADPARARHDRIIAQVRGPRAHREGSPDSPDLTAAARLEAAEERDELAYFRDIAALARDLLAEARLAMTQRDDGGAESAADRALAAADRRAAARDRELAAQERLRALVDREALAREARAPSQDL
jgi:hypothetical protein